MYVESNIGMICYIYADFVGIRSPSEADDFSELLYRTGDIIFYTWCPILWFSHLQSEIVLRRTESEYIALITVMRDVISMIY